MRQRHVSLLIWSIALAAAFLCICSRSAQKKDALACVGSTYITREDAEAFEFVSRYMPGEQGAVGLMKDDPAWAIIATEAVYQHVQNGPANRKIRSGREWEWKRHFYLSKAFEIQILQGNCGYSNAEVRNYYDTHKNDFRAIAYSETMKPCTADAVPPFDSIRGNVAKELFLSNYTRDSGAHDLRDPRMFRMFRERLYSDYFLKKYYAERHKKPLPDSVMTLCGSNGIVDTGDISVILSWMSPADREEHKKDPEFIVRRLLQWKLFAEKAVSTGYASRPEVKAVLSWAWKNEVVRKYVNKNLIPAAEKGMHIDPAMALFSYWDESGNPAAAIDSAKLKNHIARLVSQKRSRLFDSLIYRIRCARGVRFLHPDTWSDGRVKEPGKLLREADSLRDSGNTLQAQATYNILTDYYLFTVEGKMALVELAKIQAEQQQDQERLDAIRNYRRFLLSAPDTDRQCDIMYRIGFIYDRSLNRPEMAEVNYKWILQNAPSCERAGDAEIMLQHLGEPMPNAEELREEVKR